MPCSAVILSVAMVLPPIEQRKIVSTLEHAVWEDHRLEVRLAATDPSFDAALREQIAATFRRYPRLPDHRDEFPWVTSYLGDSHAPVWFLGEYPSMTQVERGTDATPQDQWAISKGDELFRQALFKHGFKEGSEMSPDGWRCYITNVVKSVHRAWKWNRADEESAYQIAEWWAGVLAWNLLPAAPRSSSSWGSEQELLQHVARAGSVEPLPRLMDVWSYAYVASRPDAARRLRPMHPLRLAEYDEQFAAVARAAIALRA